MKKLTLALAAVSLLALPSFAQLKPAAPKVGTGKAPRTAPKAPTTGGKIGTAPTAGSQAKPTVTSAPKVGISSTSQTAKSANSAPAAVGTICSANTAFSKAPKAVQAALIEGEKAGVSGSACASKISNADTLTVLASGVAAATRQVKSEGKSNAAELDLAGKARARDAFAAGISAKLGIAQSEGLERLGQAEQNGCDFTSATLSNGSVRMAALSN